MYLHHVLPYGKVKKFRCEKKFFSRFGVSRLRLFFARGPRLTKFCGEILRITEGKKVCQSLFWSAARESEWWTETRWFCTRIWVLELNNVVLLRSVSFTTLLQVRLTFIYSETYLVCHLTYTTVSANGYLLNRSKIIWKETMNVRACP